MPYTVNGVGTQYYGKRDAVSRMGQCRQCGGAGKLESYTSRLWFVILFIPLIPLKRVRILDYCSLCSRHWVANPEEFETSRQLAVSGALEKYRDHPAVESALGAHAQLLIFHMHQEADEFRQTVLERFPHDVDLRIGLGSHLDQVGRWQDATAIYEQAFELNPEHPSARHAIAWRRTNANQLDEAYDLLDFLRQPGSGQSFDLSLLETLARGYQQQKNHERTLEICSHLLREVPQAGNRHDFRKFVQKSERALHRTESLLPARSFSVAGLFDSKSGTHAPWVPWAIFSAIGLLLFMVGMAALNEHQRTHRTLYLFNGFAQPAQISIDGQPPLTVGRREKYSLAEGTHQLRISGPVDKQQEITLQTGYWTRWTNSPVWIFNLERLVAISENTVHYAVIAQPPTVRWLTDAEFQFIPHVDYAFEEPPQTMKLGKNNAVITKTHVGTVDMPPSTVLMQLIQGPDQTVPLSYAEGYLERNPRDYSMLVLYSRMADDDANKQRVTEFLKAGLWRSPISVEWHRVYSELKSVAANEAALQADYDAQLQKDPDNGVLLYLRGRVGPTRADQLLHFQLAHEKAPQSGWPAYALACDAANRGDWQAATGYCDQAQAALQADLRYRGLRHWVRVANGTAGSLEAEYRAQLQSPDFMQSMAAFFLLIDTLAAQQKPDEARQISRQWTATRIGPAGGPNDAAPAFELMTDYLCGDLEALRKIRERPPSQALLEYQFHTYLVLGDPDAAINIPSVDKIVDDWSPALSVSVAYALTGNAAEADRWRLRACEIMNSANNDCKRAAALLARDEPPTPTELDDIYLGVAETPVFLAALGLRFPDQRHELYERARSVNVSHLAPGLLVKQVLERP